MSLIPEDVFKTIRRIQIRTTRTVNDMLAGSYHSAFKGRGMEFEDVREYQPGDEVRSIDWNVTARMNHPYVKNFREERELTVMLLVDVSASSSFGSTRKTKAEYLAEIGAVLAFSAIQNNDKVGLILFSDQVEKYIPPKKGVRHVLRVIRELLVFKAKSQGTDINAALNFLGKVQKRQGVCFLISDFLAPDFSTALTLTTKRHDLIALSISDPHETTFPNVGLARIQDLETGKTAWVDTSLPRVREQLKQRAEKRKAEQRRMIEKGGGGYLELCTNLSYADRLHVFLERRQRKR